MLVVELLRRLQFPVLEDPHSAVSSHCRYVLVEGVNGYSLDVFLVTIECLDLGELAIDHAPQDSRVVDGA